MITPLAIGPVKITTITDMLLKIKVYMINKGLKIIIMAAVFANRCKLANLIA